MLEVLAPSNGGLPTFTVCSIDVTFVGADMPCLDPSTLVTTYMSTDPSANSIEPDRALLDLGTYHSLERDMDLLDIYTYHSLKPDMALLDLGTYHSLKPDMALLDLGTYHSLERDMDLLDICTYH